MTAKVAAAEPAIPNITGRARPRILLAWEAGAGRGHIMTLRSVAEALGDACIYDASLCVMDHAAEIAPLCELAFPGARLFIDPAVRSAPDAPQTATWGEFLGDTGFRSGDFLTQQIRWWQDVLTARCTDLVVADYAPCALLAANSMGIPAVVAGTGYAIPPLGLERFPVFLPEYASCLYDEQETLAIVNAAAGPLGVPPLARLSDIYRRSQELVRTLDLLDPYGGQRSQAHIPPVADFAPPTETPGDEIFLYFSTSELQDAAVVEAITTLGLPVRAFCPNLAPDMAAKLRAGGVMLEPRPVPVDLIAARSRLMVHSGQHGILSLGLAAGLPHVAIPQHLEQLFHARRCEEAGVATVMTRQNRSAEQLRTAIHHGYHSDAMRQTARTLAKALEPQFRVDAQAVIQKRIWPLL